MKTVRPALALAVLSLVASALPAAQPDASTVARKAVPPVRASEADPPPLGGTVHVAPPTGETEADRASILAALERVRPGGTVQFAPGTYLVGEIIHVTVPGITVLGHSEGTTLRGCDPTMFPLGGGLEEMFVAVVGCNGLDMAGGHQTVRGLTFEYASHALVLGGMECLEGRGCVPVLEPVDTRSGGYLVEGNTFRASVNGIRTIGQWREPAVIRDRRQHVRGYRGMGCRPRGGRQPGGVAERGGRSPGPGDGNKASRGQARSPAWWGGALGAGLLPAAELN